MPAPAADAATRAAAIRSARRCYAGLPCGVIGALLPFRAAILGGWGTLRREERAPGPRAEGWLPGSSA